MAWIESHQALRDHPKVFDLASGMDWPIDLAIGKLHRFWWWCMDYAEDGDLTRHCHDRVGQAVGLSGESCRTFYDLMVQIGWIDTEPYHRVHDWWDWAGMWLRSKYRHQPEKWQTIQAKFATVSTTVSKTLTQTRTPNLTKPNLTKEIYRRFAPPTLEDVRAHCLERKNKVDPESFLAYYEARGWKFKGGQTMKDWKAAIRTWEKNGFNNGGPQGNGRRIVGHAAPVPGKYDGL